MKSGKIRKDKFLKPILLVIISSLHLSFTVAQPPGYAAFYPFNGNTQDISSNAIHAIGHRVTLTTDMYGNSNSAYQFDGNSSHMEIPDHDSLDMDSSDYSIVAWVLTSGTSNARIFSKGSYSCEPGYMIRTNNSGQPFMENANPSNVCMIRMAGSSFIADSNWHCIVHTVDRQDGGKLFVDGILVGYQPINTTGFNISNSLPASIGAYVSATGVIREPFEGSIDDVLIYRIVLTSSEISALCQNPLLPVVEPSEPLPIEITDKKIISISPNPVRDIVKINLCLPSEEQLLPIRLSIYDNANRLVIHKVTTESSLSLNLTEIPSGFYYLKIISSNSNNVFKLQKQ